MKNYACDDFGKLFYNSDGVWQESAKFFYNNFTLIEESTADNTIIKEFVWDPIETIATRPLYLYVPENSTHLFYTHDANKNVTEVLYLATQNGLAAHYEYSPFGELRDFSHLSSTPETSNSEINAITETSNSATLENSVNSNSKNSANSNSVANSNLPENSAIAETLNSSNPSPGDLIGWRDTRITEIDIRTFNPFRFSSEYHDDELSLIYYNYRHYDPATARWLSRDPIEEQGGTNLYNFTANNPINYFDLLGLMQNWGGTASDAWFQYLHRQYAPSDPCCRKVPRWKKNGYISLSSCIEARKNSVMGNILNVGLMIAGGSIGSYIASLKVTVGLGIADEYVTKIRDNLRNWGAKTYCNEEVCYDD